MKPTAVQFSQALTVAISEYTRASGRQGATAYGLSLVLAALALAGSIFYKEITYTFGRHVMGVRAVTLWEGLVLVAAFLWLTSMALGLLCVPQKGRMRKLGAYSIAINLATAML
jgi:hypothetical protein